MISRLIDASLRNRLLVPGLLAFLLAGGLWAVRTLPVEAFPDLTANSVAIITEAPGLSAPDVEQLVTFPIAVETGPSSAWTPSGSVPATTASRSETS